MAKIAITNLYGIKDGDKAYYRKLGRHGFDFQWPKKLGSELTDEEVDDILKHKEYYLKQFGAEEMIVEKED
jgi:hypothetical protein